MPNAGDFLLVGTEDTSPGTPAAGFTVVAAVARTFAGVVYVYLALTTANDITGSPTGNLTDTLAYTLERAYRPSESVVLPFHASNTTGGVATIDTDGTVDLRAAWTTLSAGQTIVMNAFYIQ